MPRPPTRLLSPEIITDAAIRMVDTAGDFTMPGLAERLKVRPSSLYNHVSGRAEIVEAMRARIMSTIAVGARPATGPRPSPPSPASTVAPTPRIRG